MAITNNRLVTCEDGHVTFRIKERTSHTWTSRTLPAAEFIRRFLQHVLPKGCIKVRSYGLLSPRRRPALAPSRALLTACLSPTPATKSVAKRDQDEAPPTPAAPLHCPTGGGQLVFLCRLLPHKRRPPS
jgi:Putative transposase